MTNNPGELATVLQEVSESLQISIGLKFQFGQPTSDTKGLLELIQASN